jgi:hypothetical protein
MTNKNLNLLNIDGDHQSILNTYKRTHKNNIVCLPQRGSTYFLSFFWVEWRLELEAVVTLMSLLLLLLLLLCWWGGGVSGTDFLPGAGVWLLLFELVVDEVKFGPVWIGEGAFLLAAASRSWYNPNDSCKV